MILAIIGSVLKRRKYLILSIIVTIVMATVSYSLTVWTVAFKSISIYAEMNGLWFTVISLALSLTISIFLGIHAALVLFWKNLRVKTRELKGASSGIGGVVSGILATGCPSCGVPALGLFGAPLALTALPFRGNEVKLLSIALVLLSIYLICENIQKQLACPVVGEKQ